MGIDTADSHEEDQIMIERSISLKEFFFVSTERLHPLYSNLIGLTIV